MSNNNNSKTSDEDFVRDLTQAAIALDVAQDEKKRLATSQAHGANLAKAGLTPVDVLTLTEILRRD